MTKFFKSSSLLVRAFELFRGQFALDLDREKRGLQGKQTTLVIHDKTGDDVAIKNDHILFGRLLIVSTHDDPVADANGRRQHWTQQVAHHGFSKGSPETSMVDLAKGFGSRDNRSEEHTSELQSRQ